MRIEKIEAFCLEIPFKKVFKHASFERSKTCNLITKVSLEDGSVGFGEGIPREYVTGETFLSSSNALTKYFIPQLDLNFKSFEDCVDFLKKQEELIENNVIYNSSKCSLELAMLDSFGKHFKRSVSELGRVIGVERDENEKKYSYLVPLNKRFNNLFKSLYVQGLLLYGFRDFKFKIDARKDFSGIDDIAENLRNKVSLRIDANGSLYESDLDEVVEQADKRRVYCLEQPLPKGMENCLKKYKSNYPIMLDESLCSIEDAKKAIREGYGDLFNLRLSKNGGLINTLKIQKFARENGIKCQLGCMVGESGILSAAGRHFATISSDLLFFEGSYGTHLLDEDITVQDMTFGFGAMVKPLDGFGLGVEVDDKKLKKYSKKIFEQGIK